MMLKIISFNVNGIRACLTKTFEEDFYKLNADIFSLNETKLSSQEFPFNPNGYEVYHTISKLRKGYSGVAVFTRIKPLSVRFGLLNNKYDDEGRVITLEFEKFYYVAAYVPNSGDGLKRLDFRMEYEQDVIHYFKTLNKPIVYAGDLNVAHEEIDIKNPQVNVNNAGFTIQERDAMTNLLANGYIDTFRYKYPEVVKYSWWSYRFNARMNNAGWRIDYFLVSKDFIDYVMDSKIHNDIYGSDHCPIELDLDI